MSDDGTVHVTYYDFRNNTPADDILGTDMWAVHCHAASENCASPSAWDEETRVTPAGSTRVGHRSRADTSSVATRDLLRPATTLWPFTERATPETPPASYSRLTP